jgi:hypothetical protein
MSDYAKVFKPTASGESAAEMIRAAEACLDSFTACFNARDRAGMDAHLHFPHIMFSGSERLVWEEPGQLPDDFFDNLIRDGWAKTVYEEKQPVLVSPDKVHFRVRYTRQAADGRVLSEHENIWFVTRIAGRWGIALRSY